MLKQIILTVLQVAVSATVASAQGDWTWHKAIAAGKTIEIKNISGQISATPASGNEVEVIGHKRGGAGDVAIKVEEYSGGVSICAIYEPDDDCDNQHGGHRNHSWRDREDERVDFEVKVPRGVQFAARSVSGDITATDLGADVDAGTVSGEVCVSTSGVAHASSVSGSVHARIGRNDWQDLSFSSVSGSVILEMPQDLNTNVRFQTVSGDFDSDWPITVTSTRRSSYGPRGGVRGTIGSGGRELSVTTVSGNLELRKSR